jgi:hypothetical protein
MQETRVSWQSDQHGMLFGARIHDSQMLGLTMSESALSILVKRLDGGEVRVELSNLGDFNVSIWNWPIISEIFVWNINAVPEEYWNAPDMGWNALYKHISDVKTNASAAIKKRPTSFFVLVSTSYGGTLAAICDQVNVFEQN